MDFKRYWCVIKKKNNKYKLNYKGFKFDIKRTKDDTTTDIRNNFLNTMPEEKLKDLFNNNFFIDLLQQIPQNLFIAIKNSLSFNSYKVSIFNESKTHIAKTGSFLVKKSKQLIYNANNQRQKIKSAQESKENEKTV